MPSKYTDKEKEKMLSNKHLRSFATDLGICPTCSNCRLYNRATRCCKFDGADIYNQNELNTFCEWWVPMKWIFDKYKKKYPYYRMFGIDWISTKDEYYRRKEFIKRQEEGDQVIVFSDKPVVIDGQNEPSSELSTEVKQNYNQTQNNTPNDKENESPFAPSQSRIWQIFETYLNILSH